jgi:hypothetical protein
LVTETATPTASPPLARSALGVHQHLGAQTGRHHRMTSSQSSAGACDDRNAISQLHPRFLSIVIH